MKMNDHLCVVGVALITGLCELIPNNLDSIAGHDLNGLIN